MRISKLIECLEAKKEKHVDIVVCTYDTVLEDYHENVCLCTTEDRYVNFQDDYSYGKILLL